MTPVFTFILLIVLQNLRSMDKLFYVVKLPAMVSIQFQVFSRKCLHYLSSPMMYTPIYKY